MSVRVLPILFGQQTRVLDFINPSTFQSFAYEDTNIATETRRRRPINITFNIT